ncbi:hypothetical protein [Streptomyces sp. NPDC086023]|uniref:hypothetical protein n=1 Tax=Streptomyces sp. NPDC086023 TaxID=3365746 RepID=UPI0037CF8E06
MRKSLALLAVPALCVLLAACNDDGGGRNAEGTARAYVKALNDRDPDALLALAKDSEGVSGREKDAETIIAKDGGRGLEITGLTIATPTSSTYADVDITGTDNTGKPFKLALSIARDGDAEDWTITLGNYQGPTPGPTAATSR